MRSSRHEACSRAGRQSRQTAFRAGPSSLFTQVTEKRYHTAPSSNSLRRASSKALAPFQDHLIFARCFSASFAVLSLGSSSMAAWYSVTAAAVFPCCSRRRPRQLCTAESRGEFGDLYSGALIVSSSDSRRPAEVFDQVLPRGKIAAVELYCRLEFPVGLPRQGKRGKPHGTIGFFSIRFPEPVVILRILRRQGNGGLAAPHGLVALLELEVAPQHPELNFRILRIARGRVLKNLRRFCVFTQFKGLARGFQRRNQVASRCLSTGHTDRKEKRESKNHPGE